MILEYFELPKYVKAKQTSKQTSKQCHVKSDMGSNKKELLLVLAGTI